MKYVLFSLLLLVSNTLFSQSQLEQSLEKYRQDYLPEKVFVHTDKNIYAAGETIWMAVYLVDGQTHRPGTLTRLVYVELHNTEGEMILRQKLLSEDGYVAGDLALPANINPGDYQLTAYTNYQRNSSVETLFRKTIRILEGIMKNDEIADTPESGSIIPSSITNKINFRFFPEGGDCINGIPCRIAFIAEDPSGHPVKVSGRVRDEKGKVETIFKSNEFGIGKFTYTPEEGRVFQMVMEKPGVKIDIPPALKEGFCLSVQRLTDNIRILLMTSRKRGLKGARMVLHRRGQLLFEQEFEESKTSANFKFPLAGLPEGVIVATLFDDGEQAVAERLFFVSPTAKSTRIQIETDTTHLGMRQQGILHLHMSNQDVQIDSLARGGISLSIISTQALGGPIGDDIRTWLLLNSDIDHPVPFAPELIFGENERVRDVRIDEFLLTRGWRRFRWEITRNREVFIPEFLVEQGIYLRGRMGNYESPKKPRPGKVFLIQLTNGYFEETMTNEAGQFIFGPYVFHDTADIFLQPRFRLGKKNRLNPDISLKDNPYAKLELIESDSPILPRITSHRSAGELIEAVKDYQELSRHMLTTALNYDSLVIELAPIEIKGTRLSPIEEERKKRTIVHGKPDVRLVIDSMPGGKHVLTIMDLLRRASGVLVSGPPGQESILIRGISSFGSSTPTFFLDGFEVSKDIIRHFPVHDVEFIDILKGPRAAAYGARGGAGVILVYTRGVHTQSQKPVVGLLKTKMFGFHKVREFAVFDPRLPANKNRPDVRTTLHWNPKLITDEFGIAKDTFTTSDQIGKFIIIAQGLRKDGRPFYGTGEFVVE